MQLKDKIIYDFSSWEDRIDWDGIAAQNILAVVMRGSSQTLGSRYREVDRTAVDYVAQCKSRGIKTGLYHFLTPNGIAEQAALFLSQWNKVGGCELAPIVDVEVDLSKYYFGTIGQAVWQGHIKSFIDLIAAGTGKTPIIYTNKNYWSFAMTKNLLGQLVSPSWAADYPLWLAWYPTTPDSFSVPPASTIPQGWTKWAMWQYNDKGRQNGFLANDLNIASDWYAAELGAVVIVPPPPPVIAEFVSATLTRADGSTVEFVPK